MYDTIKNPKNDLNTRVQALTLLGYIACSQTTSWLISLPDHPLFKQILKLLNVRTFYVENYFTDITSYRRKLNCCL